MHTKRFLLLTVGLLFCILGCTRDPAGVIMPDDIPSSTETHEPVDIEASFEQNLLPILTAKCALAGCHVADGPHGLDFRTYESFIAGGAHGPVFIPGNAAESKIIEEIVEGRMPPEGPPLPDEEIQLFRNWINQQETQDDIVQHEHEDAHDDMDGDHEDDDDGHEDDDHEGDDHDDENEAHDDMGDDHHDENDDHNDN